MTWPKGENMSGFSDATWRVRVKPMFTRSMPPLNAAAAQPRRSAGCIIIALPS
jgi:hypothetical protein